MDTEFVTRKPNNQKLEGIVDQYFYLDMDINSISEVPEYVLPFPRFTFGYFFNNPFLVTNHNLKCSVKANMIVSRISDQKISVLPLTNRIRILGAHVKPYALAHLTKSPISELPWLINTVDLFGETALEFKENIDVCDSVSKMFDHVESVFLSSWLNRDLRVIINAINIIEEAHGNVKLDLVASGLNMTPRALRYQFQKHIGCSPKLYAKLVQLRNSIHQIQSTNNSFTKVTYDNYYFDQPHFINSFKRITGKSPNNLKKEFMNFRFLQF